MIQRPPRRPRPRRAGVGVAIDVPSALVALSVITVLSALVAPAAARATQNATPSPTSTATSTWHATQNATPSPTSTAAADLTVPTISNPGRLVSGAVDLSGTRAPGDEVRVTVDSAPDTSLCTVAPDNSDTWSCAGVELPQGPRVTVRVSATADTARSSAVTVAVLAPPTIGGAVDGVVTSSGVVRGTGYPGAQVTAQLTPSARCSTQVDPTGAWGCILSAGASDGTYSIRAWQVGPAPFPHRASAESPALPFTLDTVPPPAPTITAPVAGSNVPDGTSTRYRGTGTNGSIVTVWAGTARSSIRICSAVVRGDVWQCTGPPLAAGAYVLSAVQADAALNTSPASTTVPISSVDVASPRPNDGTPGQSTSPSTTPGGGSGSIPPSRTAPPPGTQHASPAPHTQSPAAPPVATPFTAAVQPVFSALNSTGWLTAALLALAALALFTVPVRMLAGTVNASRGNPAPRPWHLLGRNRPRRAADAEPTGTTTWTPTVFGLAFATIMVAVAMPAAPDGAAARILPAILVAVVAVNAAAVGAARLATRRFPGVSVGWRFGPALLLVVAAASVISRLLGLEPALMFGIVVAVTVQGGRARGRGIVSAAPVLALAIVATVGWAMIGVLPAPTTVVTAFTAELVNALVMLSAGSAAILLVPVGDGAGRALFRWSTGWWVILTLVVDTLLFAILAPTTRLDALGNVLLLIGLIGFAALSVALWLWRRFVAPALR